MQLVKRLRFKGKYLALFVQMETFLIQKKTLVKRQCSFEKETAPTTESFPNC